VEWDLAERRLNVIAEADTCWMVRDDRGHVRGASPDVVPEAVLAAADQQGAEHIRLEQVPGPSGEPWRVVQERLAPSGSSTPPSGHLEEGVYPFVVVTVAARLPPLTDSLRLLAGVLAVLSVGSWVVAAAVGRWLCRRTLSPVTRMAESARSISVREPGQRVAVACTGDELEELGGAFNDLLSRLQEAFERQRRFTGEASHQLRTPLTVMLGQVEVALRRDRPAEDYRRVLGIVAAQSDRLHRIVEMLLFLARADAEASLPGLIALPLRPWLTEHLAAWGTHSRAADIRLVPTETEGLIVSAHPALLGQVVDILLENACKYSRPGTVIAVSTEAETEDVLLVVEDHGCGIAPEDLPRVFEPFFQSPRLGESGAGGVGLGLAIARRVAEAMNAEVRVESELDRGSRFIVRLPRPRVGQ
jgi:signal transduction histidine kinase